MKLKKINNFLGNMKLIISLVFCFSFGLEAHGECIFPITHAKDTITKKKFHNNGSLKKTIKYVDGTRREVRLYYKNGSLKIVGKYNRNGRKHGSWNYYPEVTNGEFNGEIPYSKEYRDGKRIWPKIR